MEYIQTILAICGGISIIGGAGAVIVKVIKPAFHLTARVQKLEETFRQGLQKTCRIGKHAETAVQEPCGAAQSSDHW